VPLVPPLRPEADSVGRRVCHTPRRCRPQGPCPSRRFWRVPRHARNPCEPRHPPKHEPNASRPYSMPLASQWNCPTELSLPEEPYPLSRATCFLAGSLSDTSPARRSRVFRDRFPRPEPALCQEYPCGCLTHEPGRRFPAAAEATGQSASLRPFRPPLPVNAGLAGLRPARPLRSFAPLGSPFARRPLPWPG
jgi:hypothetical protein